MVICDTTEPPVWSGDEGLPTHRLIHEIGGSADFLQTSVRSEEEVDRAIMASVAHTGRLDVVVNNAAILEASSVTETTSRDWDRLMDVNLKGRPLAVVVTGGQRHDGVILPQMLADIRVPRVGGGRPRTCPGAVLADRAYGSTSNRDYLRSRGIRAVIPEKKDQIATRKRRVSKGG